MNTKKQKILFMGTPQFAAVILDSLIADDYSISAVVTMPDKPKGRSGKSSSSVVSVLAMSSKIPVLTPHSKAELEKVVLDYDFDIIIVAAYGMIIPDTVLNIPKYGAINVHGSLLPKYRGASPIAASILEGDIETGISIMKMVSKMDAGDIITQDKIKIENTDTQDTLTTKMANLGAKLLLGTLPGIFANTFTSRVQDESAVTYCSLISKADGDIDWSEDADIIVRKIRAYYPWPGSHTSIAGKSVKITEAEVAENQEIKPTPGEYFLDNGSLYVAAGKKNIRIISLQPDGKKQMTAKDYLNGNPKLA